MITYSEWIWSAFGEPPAFGVMKLARAAGASTSDPRTEDASAQHRSRSVRRRRVASEASDRKARDSSQAAPGLIRPSPARRRDVSRVAERHGAARASASQP